MSTIVENVRNWMQTCPLLDEDRTFLVDYLPDALAYSIDVLPVDPVYRRYVDGGALYRFEFAFTTKEAFDGDMRTLFDNSAFSENLSAWVREQSRIGNLPVMEGHTARWVEVIASGYLITADTDLAQYQSQFRLVYS